MAVISPEIFVICASLLCNPPQYDSWDILLPPPSYDHYPTQGVLEINMPLKTVDDVCTYGNIGLTQRGCTRFGRLDKNFPQSLTVKNLLQNPILSTTWKIRIKLKLKENPNACFIVIPDVDGDLVPIGHQISIRHHEWAHCNGLLHDGLGYGWYDMKTGKAIQN